MQIIISDTSCLIDLRKASLLEAFSQVSYDLVIPDVLYEEELVNFSVYEKSVIEKNFRIEGLPSAGVVEVQKVQRDNPALSLNDCFAFVHARRTKNCILLTGDKRLNLLASSSSIEVHGVLWAIDVIHSSETATPSDLYSALLLYKADSAVTIPGSLLDQWIDRYRGLLEY